MTYRWHTTGASMFAQHHYAITETGKIVATVKALNQGLARWGDDEFIDVASAKKAVEAKFAPALTALKQAIDDEKSRAARDLAEKLKREYEQRGCPTCGRQDPWAHPEIRRYFLGSASLAPSGQVQRSVTGLL